MKDDAISRQAAKLKVARVIWEDGESFSDFHDKCVDCLDDVPSAQPEIIYCKDCKHWDGVDTCDVIDAPVWDNDFCSFAERRSDE